MCITIHYYTHQEVNLRTNIVIDDTLMLKALEVSGNRTKRETVEEALKLLVAMRQQVKLRSLRGKLSWEGDLAAMRMDS